MNKCIILSLLLAAGACDRAESSSVEPKPREGTEARADNKEPPVPADNTEKNERDREPAALTPGDQGESEADRTVTQRVRQEVIKQDTLSTSAKNVKIITLNGVVTLRGPVKTAEERSDIARIAQSVGGVSRVDNQLEVASN
jgi:osmotically-inducible protein OsmY